jgi:hypothetical protein
VLAWLLALLAAPAPLAAESATPRVTVQARARFENPRARSVGSDRLELRARLVDDVGTPLAEAPLELEPTRQLDVAGCADESPRARRSLRKLTTDASGEVCLVVTGAPLSGALGVTFRGDPLHLPAHTELPLQAAARELDLAFEAPSLELDLDQPEQRLSLRVSGDDGTGDPLPAVSLHLEEAGRERPLQTRDWVRSGNTLTFRIDSEQFGSPGPARLVARLGAASQRSPARAEAVALRTVRVRLEARVAGVEAEAAQLSVTASSPAGPPTSGWVEVSLGAESAGSSPLTNGAADLRATLATPPPLQLTLRYRSDDPWWLAGDAVTVDIAAQTPSQPSHWPWLVLLAPVGYVCLRALERPASPRRAQRPAPKPALPASSPARASSVPVRGWIGTIHDAHDGRPIAGARVEATLPSLREQTLGVSSVSDEQGRFVLPPLREPIAEGARLQVTAALHSDVQRPLPPQGRVHVAMISRRRALLGRLVRWARAAGSPWIRAGEPTPGEVADVALRRGDLGTARWAEGVQAAAFAGDEVDASREASLLAQEPTWQESARRSERSDND